MGMGERTEKQGDGGTKIIKNSRDNGHGGVNGALRLERVANWGGDRGAFGGG